MKYSQPYKDCVALQRLIMRLSAEAGPKDLSIVAAASRAFCDLQETKRRIAMKPLPKSVDVRQNDRRKRSQIVVSDRPD